MTQLSIDQAFALAMQHHQAKRFSQAEQIYRAILAQNPAHADALHLLGVLAHQAGRSDRAVVLIHRSIELKPSDAQAHNNLSSALCVIGQLDEAIASARQAISLNRDLAEAHYNLGLALKNKGQLENAAAAYRQAIKIRPQYADVHGNLGNVLFDMGQLDQAIESYRRAIALNPSSAQAHNNLGNALNKIGDLAAAETACRQAIALNPNLVEAHRNLAIYLLLRGDFTQGWREYEWRLVGDSSTATRQFKQERWAGSALHGRTILLHAEQGLGDTLQFFRYFPMVQRLGGSAIIECQPQLHRLLQGMTTYPVVPAGSPLPEYDLHCPLASFPHVLGTTLESIPKNVPYIEAHPKDVNQWRTRLSKPGLKVGVAWAGNPNFKSDRTRSISLDLLAPLSQITGVNFYSLQKGEAARQAAEPRPGLRLIDLSQELGDFADTAALIANLDLVIAVDTAVAHLAGAMGKPIWTLLPFSPDWRWMLARPDSPWYPTMRLFRQPARGDWHSVIQQITEALTGLV